MKRILLTVGMIMVASGALFSQLITSTPAFPTDNVAVTIYFDASLGNAGLKDYTGDVYAHAGVITNLSTGGSDWKYVLAPWSTNIPKAKMVRVSANLYSLALTPTLREFYGVPAGEKILQLAFVFRSADGSRTGRTASGGDIFYTIYEEGLNISFSKPVKYSNLITLADSMFITVNSNISDSIVLYQNGIKKKKVTGQLLTDTIKPLAAGQYKYVARAWDEGVYKSDSVFFYVKESVVVEDLPAGSKPGVNILSSTSARFVLYAPGKNDVFVLGDFNDWVFNSGGFMKRSSDGKWFWLDVSGLDPALEYGFQYVVDGKIWIPDPYTRKVLDPWNDPWIPSTTYPNLKPYPTGKADGLVSTFKTDPSTYTWQNSSFTTPAPKDLVIYELHIRDFIAKHDFKTLTDTLGYLANLGVNVIELMPVNEFEGNSSWGYNPSMYFATDKYYGPAEDLKKFVDACHGRGIAVVLDMVLNHAYGSNPLVKLYFDSATGKVTASNPWFNVNSPNTSYSWGYDFNHTTDETKAFVDSVNRFWIREFNVDGFRFDFTKGFTNTTGDGGGYDASRIAILKRMGDRIWALKPDALLILEHFADNNEEKELAAYGFMLWGNINYNYGQASMGWDSDISWVSHIQRGWTKPNLVGYMESHDEERMVYRNLNFGNSSAAPAYNVKTLSTALRRALLAGALFYTIPGPKMMWQFEELGYDVSIDFNGRVGEKPIKWEYYSDPLRKDLYKGLAAIINLRKSQPAFTEGTFTIAQSANGGKQKRINIQHATMDVVVIGNFDVVNGSMIGGFTKTGKWYDYFSGDSITVTGASNVVNLIPGGFRIYTTKKLAPPSYVVSVPELPALLEGHNVYPNPFTTETRISLGEEGLSGGVVEIYDGAGRMILSRAVEPGSSEFTWDGRSQGGVTQPSGLYIIRISDGMRFATRKVVKMN